MNRGQPRSGAAGESTRRMAAKRRGRRALIGLSGAVMAYGMFVAALGLHRIGSTMGVVLTVLLLIGFVWFARVVDRLLDRKMSEERRALRGARAEEMVGRILESLPMECVVIHDIASPHGNIDHVVISADRGLFLIETKAHGGRVTVDQGRLMVNGRDPEKDFIAQTLKNTYWLRDRVTGVMSRELWVNAVLVFTNAFVERMPPIKGVAVVNRKYLARCIERAPATGAGRAIWEKREEIAGKLGGGKLVGDASG